MKVQEIEIKKIKGNPYQTRLHIEKEPLKLLTKSILERGLFNPITLLDDGKDKYIVVHGHRRLSAYQNLKFKTIPAFIKPRDQKESLITDLIHENLMREDLLVQEKALCLKLLLSQIKNLENDVDNMCHCISGVHMYRERGFPKIRKEKTKHTNDDVFKCMDLLKTVGMSDNNAISYLNILKLPLRFQSKVAFNVSKHEKRSNIYISIRTANILARVGDKKYQNYLFERALNGTTARHLEGLMNNYIDKVNKGEWNGFVKYNTRVNSKLLGSDKVLELAMSCERLTPKINSWKLTKLLPLSETMDQELFKISATQLKKELDLLSLAIDRRFKDKRWKKVEKIKGNEIFEIPIKEMNKKKTARGTIPRKILRKIGLEEDDLKEGTFVQIKIVGIKK